MPEFIRTNSLRVKITAIAVTAILVTIVAVFIVADLTIEDEQARQSVEAMNLISRNASLDLENYFHGIEQSTEMTAAVATDSLDSVVLVENDAAGSQAKDKERTPEQQDALDAYMTEYVKGVEETFASVAGHTQGVITYYYCISPDISEKEHGFYFSRVGKTGFRREEPLNAAALDPMDTERNSWYFEPISKARPLWVGPYKDAYLGEMWTVSYLMPIYKAGQLIGVLGMDIAADTLADKVKPIRIYKTGFACLLDDAGRIIYHPSLETGTRPDLKGMSLDDDLLNKKNSGDDLITYKAEGQKRQMSFMTLENGMKLVATAPSAEINATWTKLIRDILLLTAFIIAIAIFLLTPAVGYLTVPLRKLTAASARLAAAEYDVELEYNGNDEVGVLTDSFKKMRDQLRLNIDDLNRRIITDELTGLPNMERFFVLAKEECDRIKAAGEEPALIYLNFTGLKHFNRQFGFEEGNRLICALADILADNYGAQNVSHFSQDHFAVITSEDGLVEGLNKVFDECEHANNGRTLPLRAGIYPFRLEEVKINTAADRAKYASDLHRDTFASGFYYFDEKMLKHLENVRYIMSRIDTALREGQIEVYYQPIVDAKTGEVCDEEALSRWNDPEWGMLSPDEFVPALENARLIYKLDLYVIEQVIGKIKDRIARGETAISQSVNLSRADFESCDIVEEVRRRVDGAGIGRDMINVEITESMIGEDFAFMKEQIARFRDLGFKVWMDDFGSGFSTLEVLSEIRFDLIKIDMRYMQHFDDGEDSKVMLREMIHMARALDLDTVCEGVETAEQVEFLKKNGCSRLQGYFFCKPAPYKR